MVYLIADTDKKFCKIGYSKHPNKRLKELQRETILRLELLYAIVGTIGTERYIQSRYSHLNASREWFKYRGDIAGYFKKCHDDAENITFRVASENAPPAYISPLNRLSRRK